MYSICYSCIILMDLEYSPKIFERHQVPNFMKTHSLVAELFHEDGRKEGQTDMIKFILYSWFLAS